jgi:predicted metal-binding membrane protein
VSNVIVTRILLRERVLLTLTLIALVGLSWAYLIWMAADMAAQGGATIAHCAAMPGMTSSSVVYLWWLFVMWAVMGIAMMLPTAWPLVALYARFSRQRQPDLPVVGASLHLVLGYLLIWFGFGIAAALVQWGLEHLGAVTPVMGKMQSPLVAGIVLIGAGAFQLSPLKAMCLSKCRSPLGFLMTGWRDGKRGAVAMGFQHGAFCLGCCWALMLVMFVVGVMNLFWMAGLGVLMLLEKVAPRGDLLARFSGVALILLGLARIFL